MKKKVMLFLMGMLLWVSNVWAIEVIKLENIKLTAYPHHLQKTSCGDIPTMCSLALPRTLKEIYNIPCQADAYVVGVGWFLVQDTMSKKYDKSGDIFRGDRWLPSVKACKEWGVINVTIYIYVRGF